MLIKLIKQTALLVLFFFTSVVTYSQVANKAPTIEFVDHARYIGCGKGDVGHPLCLTATAKDVDGKVAVIMWYVNDTPMLQSDDSNYQFVGHLSYSEDGLTASANSMVIYPTEAGVTYKFKVMAKDNNGTWSEPKEFTVVSKKTSISFEGSPTVGYVGENNAITLKTVGSGWIDCGGTVKDKNVSGITYTNFGNVTDLGTHTFKAELHTDGLTGTMQGTGYMIEATHTITILSQVDPVVRLNNSRLKAISTRSWVANGDSAQIAGFVIGNTSQDSTTTKVVLIRAIGPQLAGLGITDALEDPIVTVYNADGVRVGGNDNWSDGNNKEQMLQEFLHAGVAPFTENSKDAALLITLPPGGYTAVVTPKDGTSEGVGMVEVYELY